MVPLLVLVSGCIELAFGVSAILMPAMVVAGVGGAEADLASLSLIRLLGVATFALGVGALLGRNWAAASGDHAMAYGLGSYAAISLAVYNILAAPALLFGALQTGSQGLWAGGLLHGVIGLLFLYALARRR
ncbi:hypothetical protein AUC68_00165 [Methyloceanibacter methanicus]|uniref:Major facilitator superfamily (MFS) profile domain-containing protein n=1 Tax=Methyloceanibacter methanicus TaxID=1774968 RepID=A0A1E3W664_9HYPH|nr:hypothetical protein [Methyloceanibacter methanicus]ODS01325.1 hypothetical protein AUC68_00165 [Methyloceanibacter methanicus]